MDVADEIPQTNPCQPSKCGPYSQCRVVRDRAICSCLPDMKGTPPNCRPECIINQECPSTRTCNAGKCIDPCIGACGQGSFCRVVNHVPMCECNDGYEGNI